MASRGGKVSVTAKIDYDALRQALQKSPDNVKKSTHSLLERAAIQTQGVMRQKVKTGVSGELKKSIQYKFLDYLTVQIAPTAKHAAAHEFGARPHWVGVRHLKMWADLKGINVYALQRHIAKKGTKKHPFVKPTFTVVDNTIFPEFSKGMDKTISKLLE